MSEHFIDKCDNIIDACEGALTIFSYFTLFNIDRLTDETLAGLERFAVESYRHKYGDSLLGILESIRMQINHDSCEYPPSYKFKGWISEFSDETVKFVDKVFSVTPHQKTIYSSRSPEDSEAVLLAKNSLMLTMSAVSAVAINIVGCLEQIGQPHQDGFHQLPQIPPIVHTLFCDTQDYALKFLNMVQDYKCADIARTLISWSQVKYRSNLECCKPIEYMNEHHYGWLTTLVKWLNDNGHNINYKTFTHHLNTKTVRKT